MGICALMLRGPAPVLGAQGLALQPSHWGCLGGGAAAGVAIMCLIGWLAWRRWRDQRAAAEKVSAEARRRQQAELTHAKETAEAASQAKDHFLAVLSHELRTPLTPVLAALDMLESDAVLAGALRNDLELIRRNVQLETRLIDDLLDLTRITRGKLQLTMTTVDVHMVVRDVVLMCEREIAGKGLGVGMDLQATESLVQGDEARLHQIIWNLLKNAAKFTPPGGTIAIRTYGGKGSRGAAALGAEGSRDARQFSTPSAAGPLDPLTPPLDPSTPRPLDPWIVVEVSDTGMGIEPDVLPRIFKAFEQGSAAVNREHGGLGLGLAISYGLAERHGGSLRAASEGKGRGATFTLTLPVGKATAAPPRSAVPAVCNGVAKITGAHGIDGTGLRVLLVDDHRDTSHVLSRLLRTDGYRVTVADSVQTALAEAAAQTFDVVVSDIGLPDGTGLDLMRALKERYGWPGIALSGYGMEEDVQKSLAAGFAVHLVKPVEYAKLAPLIGEVARQGRTTVGSGERGSGSAV